MSALARAGEKQAVISATGFLGEYEGETKVEYAPCSGKKRALGGGVVQSGVASPYDFYITASGPLAPSGTPTSTKTGDVAKRWTATVVNSSGTRDYKVLAICARAPGATIEVASFSVDNGEEDKKTVKCSGSRRALGGGVLPISPPGPTEISASGPVDRSGEVSRTKDGDIAKGWYGAGANFSGENHIRFKVLAICARDSNATIETAKFSSAAFDFTDAYATDEVVKCPGAKRAVGGGVATIGSPSGMTVMASGPLDNTGSTSETSDGDAAKYWYTALVNFSQVDKTVKVSAICV